MPVPKKDAMIGSMRESVLQKIKVSDVSKNPTPGENQWGKPDKPFIVTYKVGDKEIKSESSGTIKPKDWVNCFKMSDAGFVQYKRWSDHIMTLAVLMHGDSVPVPFDVNSVIGFEFEAELVELEGRDPFIDWMSAFQSKGVKTPSQAEIESLEMPGKQLNSAVTMSVDDSNLPF